MLQIETWQRVLIWLTVVVGLLFALPNGFYAHVERYNDATAAGGNRPRAGPVFCPQALSIWALFCAAGRIFWAKSNWRRCIKPAWICSGPKCA